MATYVNDLRLKEIGTGESSGTWGTETNVNLELIGEAMGYGTEAITTNADTHASTVADGSTDAARSMYIKYTGTLDSACTITIGPNTMSRVHIIENATSGSQNIIIKQGSGAEVTIPNGFVKAVYLDGAGSGAAVTEAFADLSIGPNLRIGNAAAEDTAIVFDGNAQDFYIGLDDSADDLIIGLGSTVGTTPIISVDENKDVAIPDGSLTITTGDNSAALTVKSTDTDASIGPIIDLSRDNSDAADGDVTGTIRFIADDDGNNQTTYVQLVSKIVDASDTTEDGSFHIETIVAGSTAQRIDVLAAETVFNEGSADIDFRVESNGNANMLFVDGANDRIGIGTNSPDNLLHIKTTGSTPSIELEQDAGTSYKSLIKLAGNDLEIRGSSGAMEFYTGNNDGDSSTLAMSIDSSQRVLIGADSGDAFNADSMLRLQRTGDRVFIQIKTDTDQDSGILFGNTSDDVHHHILYSPSNDTLSIKGQSDTHIKSDAAGHVTMPKQSSFHVRRNGDQSGYNAETSGSPMEVVVFNHEEHDTNSDFNTTTGKFTAPVDGTYYFQAAVYTQGNNIGQQWFNVNDARAAGTDTVNASAHEFPEASAILKLDANDTVGFKPYKASATSITVTANVNHTWFRGTLLH